MSQLVLSLGPFQGITDAPFRNVFKRHFGGIDKYYTPFFTGIHKEEHARNLQGEEIDPQYNDVETLTPQILSTDAEEILRFAKQCKALGYKEINLNMGCPFPRVANKKRGCGLLPYPDKVEAMFERVFEEIDILFSVKCRLGYFDPEEIEAIIPIFNKFPLSELTIHPRIGKQLYKGEADVERFKALIPYINAPLVYNGDIFSVESFKRIRGIIESSSLGRLRVKPAMTPMERTSPENVIAGEDPQSPTLIDSFMLGRGILTNPFLAEDIKASVIARRNDEAIQKSGSLDCFVPRKSSDSTLVNDAKRQSEKAERLYNYVLDLYEDRLHHAGGSPKVLGRMKELWSYMMNSFEEPQMVWRKIKKINALKEYEDVVELIFKENALIL